MVTIMTNLVCAGHMLVHPIRNTPMRKVLYMEKLSFMEKLNFIGSSEAVACSLENYSSSSSEYLN